MVNRQNYRWVRSYLAHLSDHRQLDAKSVACYWFYLRHLLLWAMERALSEADRISPSFAVYLSNQRHSGHPLSAPTLKRIIATSQRLFHWLRTNHLREFRHLPEAWVDTLSPPKRATGIREHRFVSLDYVRQITSLVHDPTDLAARRDQAAAAMLFLSGMRASAFISLPIGCVDIGTRTIRQDPSVGVRTKNGKSQLTYLLDIPALLAVAQGWHSFVTSQLPPSAMWYTAVTSRWGEQVLSADPPGANRNVALGKRLRILAGKAGLPYLSPHKYRHGHAVYALQRAKDMADYKAVSQNLMHDDIRVTDSIYAPLLGSEVQQRISGLNARPSPESLPDALPRPGEQPAPTTQVDDELTHALNVIARRLTT